MCKSALFTCLLLTTLIVITTELGSTIEDYEKNAKFKNQRNINKFSFNGAKAKDSKSNGVDMEKRIRSYMNYKSKKIEPKSDLIKDISNDDDMQLKYNSNIFDEVEIHGRRDKQLSDETEELKTLENLVKRYRIADNVDHPKKTQKNVGVLLDELEKTSGILKSVQDSIKKKNPIKLDGKGKMSNKKLINELEEEIINPPIINNKMLMFKTLNPNIGNKHVNLDTRYLNNLPNKINIMHSNDVPKKEMTLGEERTFRNKGTPLGTPPLVATTYRHAILVDQGPTFITLEFPDVFRQPVMGHQFCVVLLRGNKSLQIDPSSFSEREYTVFNSINSWVRDVPIVVAEFRRSGMPFKFTVGDGKVYGGFENGPLLPSSFYEFFIREIHVETANSKVEHFELSPFLRDNTTNNSPVYATVAFNGKFYLKAFMKSTLQSRTLLTVLIILLLLALIGLSLFTFRLYRIRTAQWPYFFKRKNDDPERTSYNQHKPSCNVPKPPGNTFANAMPGEMSRFGSYNVSEYAKKPEYRHSTLSRRIQKKPIRHSKRKLIRALNYLRKRTQEKELSKPPMNAVDLVFRHANIEKSPLTDEEVKHLNKLEGAVDDLEDHMITIYTRMLLDVNNEDMPDFEFEHKYWISRNDFNSMVKVCLMHDQDIHELVRKISNPSCSTEECEDQDVQEAARSLSSYTLNSNNSRVRADDSEQFTYTADYQKDSSTVSHRSSPPKAGPSTPNTGTSPTRNSIIYKNTLSNDKIQTNDGHRDLVHGKLDARVAGRQGSVKKNTSNATPAPSHITKPPRQKVNDHVDLEEDNSQRKHGNNSMATESRSSFKKYFKSHLKSISK